MVPCRAPVSRSSAAKLAEGRRNGSLTDKKEVNERSEARRTAGEAGWHVSRYNLSSSVPGKNSMVIVNLFKGICAEYSAIEMYLLSVLESLDEHHPIIERLACRGNLLGGDMA